MTYFRKSSHVPPMAGGPATFEPHGPHIKPLGSDAASRRCIAEAQPVQGTFDWPRHDNRLPMAAHTVLGLYYDRLLTLYHYDTALLSI